MYIDKIDDFVDKLLDDYYINIFKTDNKEIDNIIKEKNFIKFQKEINDIILKYHSSVNYNKLKETLINQENIKIFDELIKKYITIYFFLFIAGFYKDSLDIYSNNIVEFSKNQLSFKLKINEFFNSESNSNIINFFRMIKNLEQIFEVYDDDNKIKLLIKRPEFKESFMFLNDLGEELIDNNLRKIKDDKMKLHNLLKLIIIINIYQKNDKKEISKILENTNIEGEEYTYIDIVIPTKDNIDYVTIESLLNRKEILSGYTNLFWDYIIENQDNISRISLLEETIENKILHLVNSGILTPVLDDFLLYHKDSERYDKNLDLNVIKDIKKTDETKIKYIITKIDTTSDLYSKNAKDEKIKSNIKKNFYTPLNNRKAILVNNNEEMKIITKLVNQGSKAMESNEYFNELANYRVYPYINFKDFKDFGFSVQLNKTVTAVRAVSFEKIGEFRQNKHYPLQLRVGSKNEYVNIVGFMIPTNLTPIECLKVRDVKDIHDYGDNGYELTMSYLSEATIKNTSHKSSILWLLNPETDEVKENNYNQNTKLTSQDELKKIVSNFYDDLLIKIYDEFSRKIDSLKEIHIQKAKKIFEQLEKRTLKINKNITLYNEVENKIYEKAIIKEEKYDEKEDIFMGLGGIVKELPKYDKKENKSGIIKLDVSKEKEDNLKIEIERIEGICQHNISWENILKIKKTDPIKFQEKFYEFIQDYVMENNVSDYICKSCSTQIDLKKFDIDGTFDDESSQFITFASLPIDPPLEELPEYEKYKIAIRSLDKVIEKISVICNIPAYIGNIYNSRSKRKNVSKDLIDIVIDNNHFLKKNIKERNELSTKLYGISRELSILFVFEMENSIFVFSSKEKDYYKNIKYNNILAYLIILLCLDINDSQLSFMLGDKKGLCNIHVFEKYGHVLFDNLKILKNRNGDTEPIKNNIILCYMIYVMSCMLTKYSMWHYEKEDKASKKFNPTVQKIIIHTTIDLLNSIIDNSNNKKAGMIFKIISNKFYMKLNTFFNNNELYNKLKQDDSASIASDRKTFVLPKTILHKIEKYEPMTDFELPKYSNIKNRKYIPPKKTIEYQKQSEISNITNCDDGKFHIWVAKDKDIICTLCNKNLKEIKLSNEKENKEIQDKNKYLVLNKIANKYCISGSMHIFIKNKNGENICKLCNKNQSHKYSEKELDQLNTNLNKIRFKLINNLNDLSKETTPVIINKLEENYNKSVGKNLDQYIENFIKKIEQNIGEIENKDIYLRDNIYIIDHSYDGGKIEKSVILTDKDNRIMFRAKHPFFKTDVLTYSFNKSKTNKIEVFYDAITKVLLGHKETSKDFVINYKTENRLKVNYSLLYKLKYIGLDSNFIDIYSKVNKNFGIDNYKQMKESDKENVIYETIHDISRERIKNLKKIIYEIQRFINQIKNNYIIRSSEKKIITKYSENDEDQSEEEIEVEDISYFEKILDKYSKKISELKTSDEKNNNTIFDKWNLITDNISTKLDIKDYRFNINIDENSKIIEADEIIKFDQNGNLLLYYIINELKNLLDFNTNKYIKTNTTVFIVELINYLFNLFNLEYIQSNISVKRLEYILNGLIFADDLENELTKFESSDEILEEEVPENPTDEDIDQLDDAREEADALDIDGEFDFMSNYENIHEENEYNRF